jgi:menaquinone-dependent protoporphyrinogen oxidase
MSKVLVCYASKMGSTKEIAQAVGHHLTDAGFAVDVFACDLAPDARMYDAVVVGSALYLRHWRREALDYLKSQAPDLAERPTWLFQSGPCGSGAWDEPVSEPHAVHQLAAQIGLRPPTTFGGRLERASATDRMTRWVADGPLAGDFRDWDRIRRWSEEIAAELDDSRGSEQPSEPQPAMQG